MKLLFVSFQHPWPPDIGGRQRRFYLAREFARRHEMHLVTLLPQEVGDRGEWERFSRDHFASLTEVDCRTWQPADRPTPRWRAVASNLGRLFGSPSPRFIQNWQISGAVEFFQRLRQTVPHDMLWVDRSYFGAVAARAGFSRFVVDVDELHTVNAERAGAVRDGQPKWTERIEQAKVARYERSLPERFWRLVVCKQDDRDFFRSGRDRVFVVPNGVDPQPQSPAVAARPGHVLFVGAMDYLPNQDAAIWFAKDILPKLARLLPETTFHVLGQKPTPEVLALANTGRVVVHGRVPEVQSFYDQASVVVAPIRLGSGTRLKVLEALNYGKALVATPTAVEGLGLAPGRDFLSASGADEFASECARVLSDPNVRANLGAVGRATVLDRFQWRSVAERAEAVFAP